MKNDLEKLDLCPICGGNPCKKSDVVLAGDVAVCGDCGSWYRVPRPSADELAKIYDKDYYRSWGLYEDEEMVWESKRATFRPLLSRVEKLLGTQEDRSQIKLLDVGAATGMLLKTAEEFGWELYATDVNPYSAEMLCKRYGQSHIFQGELEGCGFEQASFDVITMTDVIEHVLDVKETLQAARRLLKKDGVLCITTPRIDSFSRFLMKSCWLHFKQEHIQYFSSSAIEKALSETGYGEIQISGHSKCLAYDYVRNQLLQFRHWLLTPLVSFVGCLLSRGLRSKPISFCCGEMLVISRTDAR